MSLMPYQQAFDLLIQQLPKKNQAIEDVPLMQAQGRILAKSIQANQDSPRFNNSAMDGYAVSGLNQLEWYLVDYISAGDQTHHIALQEGQAVRIFTGAAIPQGSDAVIPQEDTEVDMENELIKSLKTIKPMQHIRLKAEEYSKDSVLFYPHQKINATTIAVAASQGISQLSCYKKLKISIFSTGNELQQIGSTLQENQIYDSNRLMLLSLLQQHHYIDLIDGGVLLDDLATIEQQLAEAAKHSDIIIISGGASVGDKDFTKTALQALGTMEYWKLDIKPGKPFGWGKIDHCQVYLLPGNPVACWLTYFIMVLPAIKNSAGLKYEDTLPCIIETRAEFEIKYPQKRQQFLRGRIRFESNAVKADIYSQQSSSMLANCAISNALIIIPANTTIAYGDNISVIYLPEI